MTMVRRCGLPSDTEVPRVARAFSLTSKVGLTSLNLWGVDRSCEHRRERKHPSFLGVVLVVGRRVDQDIRHSATCHSLTISIDDSQKPRNSHKSHPLDQRTPKGSRVVRKLPQMSSSSQGIFHTTAFSFGRCVSGKAVFAPLFRPRDSGTTLGPAQLTLS